MNTTHRKLLIAVAIAALLAFAGCTDGATDTTDESEDLAKDTGGEIDRDAIGTTYWFEAARTESNHDNLVRKRPPFEMDDSLERQNIIERLKHLNDRENEHHVYGLSNDGKVIFYMMAQGKVSSVNSKLTNDKQIVKSQQCIDTAYKEDESGCFKTVESPQMDGSYGENGAAIFWFTPAGDYVEWNGKYLVSEEPKQITTEVTLIETVDGDSPTNETAE